MLNGKVDTCPCILKIIGPVPMNLQLKKMFRRTETNQTNLTQAAFLYNVLVLKEITQKGYLH